MVLAELGRKLTETLKKVTKANKIDEAFLTEILNEIVAALLSSDVSFMHVAKLQKNVKAKVMAVIKN